MQRREETVKIRCFRSTVYTLKWPDYFLQTSYTFTRTLIGFCFQHAWKNEDTIAFLKERMPDLERLANEIQEDSARANESERKAKLLRCYTEEDAMAVNTQYKRIARKIKKYPKTARQVMGCWEKEVGIYEQY